jgi:hypothetical protein
MFVSLLFVQPMLLDAAYATDVYLLKRNHLMCDLERDIVELADTPKAQLVAKVTDRLRDSLNNGDDNFSCLPFSDIQRLANLERRRTSKGNDYYCFNLAHWDYGFQPERMCSLPQFVTTTAAEITSRKGSYKITDESKFAVFADCAEGGNVLLTKPKGAKSWMRQSIGIFPLEAKRHDIPVGRNLSQAIRDGCKGVDYKD